MISISKWCLVAGPHPLEEIPIRVLLKEGAAEATAAMILVLPVCSAGMFVLTYGLRANRANSGPRRLKSVWRSASRLWHGFAVRREAKPATGAGVTPGRSGWPRNGVLADTR